jgi:putative membrane protein
MILEYTINYFWYYKYYNSNSLTGETKFGETKFGEAGTAKTIYYIILFTHIPLADIILPFILFTAYRALIGEWPQHKKPARITWPVWFYVAVTGVAVYLMISPYYN